MHKLQINSALLWPKTSSSKSLGCREKSGNRTAGKICPPGDAGNFSVVPVVVTCKPSGVSIRCLIVYKHAPSHCLSISIVSKPQAF